MGMNQNREGIRVGTCGYSYAEWTAAGFYPPGTSGRAMLPRYAEVFPAVEINHTWYKMPGYPAMERMQEGLPPGFRFAAKLTRTMTHEVDPARWRDEAARYREGVAPLVQSGRLTAVLIQFPRRFSRTPGNRYYLANLLDILDGLPLAVEFRNRSWAEGRVFAALEARRVCLVAVDAPGVPGLFPMLDAVTHPGLFYVRLHGRNKKGWGSGNMQQQFDYDYTEAELAGLADRFILKMAEKARTGVIFFNNHVRGQAPKNALLLTRLLQQRGLFDPAFPGGRP